MSYQETRRFRIFFILLVLSLTCLLSITEAKRNLCGRKYGHSCWGGHGKREGPIKAETIIPLKPNAILHGPPLSQFRSTVSNVLDEDSGLILSIPIPLGNVKSSNRGSLATANEMGSVSSYLPGNFLTESSVGNKKVGNKKALYTDGRNYYNKLYTKTKGSRNEDLAMDAWNERTALMKSPSKTVFKRMQDEEKPTEPQERGKEEIDSDGTKSSDSSDTTGQLNFDNSIFLRERKENINDNTDRVFTSVFYTDAESISPEESKENLAEEVETIPAVL